MKTILIDQRDQENSILRLHDSFCKCRNMRSEWNKSSESNSRLTLKISSSIFCWKKWSSNGLSPLRIAVCGVHINRGLQPRFIWFWNINFKLEKDIWNWNKRLKPSLWINFYNIHAIIIRSLLIGFEFMQSSQKSIYHTQWSLWTTLFNMYVFIPNNVAHSSQQGMCFDSETLWLSAQSDPSSRLCF